MKKKNWIYLAVALAVVLLDQFTKALVARNIERPLTVIPGFFDLSRVHNRGAVFGLFSGTGGNGVFWILTLAATAALVIIVYLFGRTPGSEKTTKFSLALIIGGALGNLVDRVARGHVIDFLDFHIGDAHWPSFNVADSAITIGVVLVLFTLLRRR